MIEWIDVPVAEVAVGDEVRIDGFGVFRFQDQTSNVELSGKMEVLVVDVAARYVTIKDGHGESRFRRSSIVAVRRRTPEPSPQPGDWRCRVPGTCPECLAACGCISREVYRASGGWSRDTRTGQPWVMQNGDPVEVVVKALAGTTVGASLRMAWVGMEPREDGEPLSHHYKRIGLTVNPVDRRGKR